MPTLSDANVLFRVPMCLGQRTTLIILIDVHGFSNTARYEQSFGSPLGRIVKCGILDIVLHNLFASEPYNIYKQPIRFIGGYGIALGPSQPVSGE
jgi:hypothetical protein